VESDADNDTLSEKLRKIDAYNDDVQGCSQVNGNNSDQQIWRMEEDPSGVNDTQELHSEIQAQKELISMFADGPSLKTAAVIENILDEKEVGDARVINSQESVVTDDGQNRQIRETTDDDSNKK
jgi:hypothetical protein